METFLIVAVLWVFSVCLHEFGHAYVAWRGGDYTIPEKGYLTLNPLKYTHPVYSVLLPLLFVMLGGIGLPGGAVYINRHLLRSRTWDTGVSLAGPAMNLMLIGVIGALFLTGVIPADGTNLATISMAFVLQLQVSALLLNLLPIPPLDGFQALAPWLPEAWREKAYGLAQYGMIIIFALFWFVPPFRDAFWFVIFVACSLLGVNPAWGFRGYEKFRFWEAISM